MFERAILHLDLDAFFVSVEILKNSALRGKPIIIGGTSGRGVVSSCSYEARAFGIHSAMPMKMALRLCPEAQVIRGDFETYQQHSRVVTDIIREEAPVFEKASIDEFYLDLTGMDQHFGCYQWSGELRKRIVKESGLPISFGLSINKTVSKIGTNEAKPDGQLLIPRGTEKNFLAPLSIRKIPSVGKSTYRKLSFMGVRTIRILAELPPRLLEREFGKFGVSLWKKANAIDDAPVVPYDEKKSISAERTFQIDTIDVALLRAQLQQMVSDLAFELRQSQKLTSVVTVKLRYSDFNTYTRQKKIPYTANDKELLRYVYELFEKLNHRRVLVRLVGVRFSGLVRGHPQISLFDQSVKEVNLQQQMDHIRKRFGKELIGCASTLGQIGRKR
ncbi:MAG: DNA polymerase IV [Bacteroidota bacterium]